MDKEERKKLESDVERAAYDSMTDASYWAKRRSHWDDWGSPVGLTLAWAPGLVCIGVFLYLLHLAGLIG